MDFSFFKKSRNTFLFLVFFSLISLPVFYYLVKADNKLPIYNPADINPKLVDASVRSKTKNHKVSYFKLTNQNGKTITNKDFENKIYITDFFFTRCQTICLVMAYNMS